MRFFFSRVRVTKRLDFSRKRPKLKGKQKRRKRIIFFQTIYLLLLQYYFSTIGIWRASNFTSIHFLILRFDYIGNHSEKNLPNAFHFNVWAQHLYNKLCVFDFIWFEYVRMRNKVSVQPNHRYQFHFSGPFRFRVQEIWTKEAISLQSYIIDDKWNNVQCRWWWLCASDFNRKINGH